MIKFYVCGYLWDYLEPGVLDGNDRIHSQHGTVKITDGFLLGAAIMFEIPLSMILLSGY